MINRIERILGSFLISVLVFLFLLFVLDKPVAKFLNRHKEAQGEVERNQRELFFSPVPYAMFGGAIKNEENTYLNEIGYRGPIPISPKPKDEFRVLILGGSTVLIGSPTLGELIQEKLITRGHDKVKVYSFGVAASILRMDIARLIFGLGDEEPDLIIFYGGGNDIVMPFQADPRPGYSPNFLVYENNPLATAGTSKQSLVIELSSLMFRSEIISILLGNSAKEYIVGLPELRKANGWGTPAWSEKIVESYLSNVALARRMSEVFDAKPIFIFQPLLYFKNLVSPAERSNFDQTELREHALLCRSLILSQTNQGSKIYKTSFVDISDIFQNEERAVFTDGIHINQNFYDVIAESLFTQITKSL